MRPLLSLTLSLLLLSTSPPAASAKANIGFKAIGGRLSYVNVEHLGSTVGFGGLVDLGTFAPQVGFGASLDLWFKSGNSVDHRDIILGVNSRYLFNVKNPKLQPYAGGGLALHFFHSDFSNIGVSGASDSDTDLEFGLDFFAGTTYQVGNKIDLLGEVMYRWMELDQVVISIGVMFRLGS